MKTSTDNWHLPRRIFGKFSSGEVSFLALTATVLCLLICLGPVLILTWKSVSALVQGDAALLELALPVGRRLVLLKNTLVLGLAVSAASLVLGVLLGTMFLSPVRINTMPVLALLLLFMVVPPYVHGLSWLAFSDRIQPLLSMLPGAEYRLAGWSGAAWIQIMSFSPLAVGLCLLGAAAVPHSLKEAGRLQSDDRTVWQEIVLPMAQPALAAASGLVMLMSITDYIIPTLFQKSVYTLEVFAEYSASGNPTGAFWLSLPLLVLAVALFYLLCRPVLVSGWQPERQSHTTVFSERWPKGWHIARQTAWFWASLLVLVPLAVLVTGSGSLAQIANSIQAGRKEITNSLITAVLAGALSLPLAVGAAILLQKNSKQMRSVFLLLLLVAVAVPPPLMGIGLVSLWNRPLPVDVYGSRMMPILAALARFLPLVILIVWTQVQRVDRTLLEAAEMLPASVLTKWRRVVLPLLRPGLVAGFCLMAALSLGELGATMVVTPPGYSTLAIRIFNLLHYGARDAVAGLCLFLLLLILMCAAGVAGSLSENRGTGKGGKDHDPGR